MRQSGGLRRMHTLPPTTWKVLLVSNSASARAACAADAASNAAKNANFNFTLNSFF
jgi:hypothetical protein